MMRVAPMRVDKKNRRDVRLVFEAGMRMVKKSWLTDCDVCLPFSPRLRACNQRLDASQAHHLVDYANDREEESRGCESGEVIRSQPQSRRHL